MVGKAARPPAGMAAEGFEIPPMERNASGVSARRSERPTPTSRQLQATLTDELVDPASLLLRWKFRQRPKGMGTNNPSLGWIANCQKRCPG